MDEKIAFIAQDNGSEVVMIKLAEECSEYAAAVVKYLIREGTRDKCLEEMADVMVMVKQAEIVMSPWELDRIHEIMEGKIDRQVERIKAR